MLTWPLLTLLLLTTPAFAEPIVGLASVIDGDTLDFRGTRIRLHGIDAPKSGQTCKDAGELHAQVEDLKAQLAVALAMIP